MPMPPRPPSLLATRWRRHGWKLMALHGGLLLLLVATAGGWWMGRDFVNYLRIRHGNPATTQAEVLEVRPGEKTTKAVVRFTPPRGTQIRLRRTVSTGFGDDHPPGSHVTVEYLPSEPQVARIRDWDTDGRQWPFLLFVPAFMLMSCHMVGDAAGAWVLPLRSSLRWVGETSDGAGERPCTFRAPEVGPQTLGTLFPQRH
jgi:hypothetical protein